MFQSNIYESGGLITFEYLEKMLQRLICFAANSKFLLLTQ